MYIYFVFYCIYYVFYLKQQDINLSYTIFSKKSLYMKLFVNFGPTSATALKRNKKGGKGEK